MKYGTVPRCWDGETVVCIGTGPSLRQADIDTCRGRARVVVVNNAYQLAPDWADVMYACDAKFWRWHKGAPLFTGRKYALEYKAQPAVQPNWPGVEYLRNLGRTGLSVDPSGLKTGHDSGYQAINLAVLFGAAKILLLGYDMRVEGKRDHYFGSHPDRTKPNFLRCLSAYKTLVGPLRSAGIEVINCSRQTALTAFPRMTLAEAFARTAVAA